MNFSNLLYFILITALVSLPLSIAAPSITYAQDTELVFDAKKNKWVRRPAGEIKKAALKRWANISPSRVKRFLWTVNWAREQF